MSPTVTELRKATKWAALLICEDGDLSFCNLDMLSFSSFVLCMQLCKYQGILNSKSTPGVLKENTNKIKQETKISSE